MDGQLLGQFAAIITSCLWTINSIFFAQAGKRIGAISVNAFRIIFAVIFLVVTHILLFREVFPSLIPAQWFWIGVSGIIGLGIGDFALFAALVIIGPRLSMLMMAMSPIFAAFFGYFLLGEVLSTYAIGGIIITLVGISSVILVTKEHQQWDTLTTRQSIWGTFLALVGAIGQGSGVVFAKKGILLNPILVVHPLSAALVRMVAGAIFIWICVLIAGKLSTLNQALHNSQGMKFTTAGAFVGPFLGVTFSMLAVTYADVGVAQTLMSLMPILIIPLMWVLYRQKTSLRGVFGACIAIIGVSILFLI